MDIVCAFCEKPIEHPDSRDTWREVIGWERHAGVRTSGKHGGSDITLRRPHPQGRLAHDHCLQLTKQGVDVDQTTLV